MLKNWEDAPVYYKRLDVSALLQEAGIDDVEMEEAPADADVKPSEGEQEGTSEKKEEEEEDEEITNVRD